MEESPSDESEMESRSGYSSWIVGCIDGLLRKGEKKLRM